MKHLSDRHYRLAKKSKAYFYLLPALILLGVFAYWPLCQAFKLALYRSDGLGLNQFVGLGNFRELACDTLLRHTLKVLGLFFLGLPLGIFGPLLGAKLMHSVRNARMAYLYRVLLVLPVVIPAMTIILIWQNLYALDGAVNQILRLVGLRQWATSWLGNPGTVIPAIIFMGMPWTGGISMLICLAGFLNIPRDLYEAADLDGASTWDIMRNVEIPLLLPQIRIVAVLACLGLIQTYDNILVLTNGGPGNATLVPGLCLFKNGFEFGRLGYASAIGFVLFVLCLFLSLLNMALTRKRE